MYKCFSTLGRVSLLLGQFTDLDGFPPSLYQASQHRWSCGFAGCKYGYLPLFYRLVDTSRNFKKFLSVLGELQCSQQGV